jgi:hypothetical protein
MLEAYRALALRLFLASTCVVSLTLALPARAQEGVVVPAQGSGASTGPGAGAALAGAQTPDADDPDASPRALEPDFTVVNLPTTLPLPLHKSNFRLTHRFNGNLREGSFGFQLGNLFGLDQGASIGIEYRYAVVRHLQAIVYRTNIDKTFEFTGKYDGWQQGASMPLSVSAVVSVEGANNFRRDYAPSVGAVLGRTIGSRAAFYATPVWVHNSASTSGVTRDTGFLGLGGRVKLSPHVYAVAEVSPRLGGYVAGDAEYAFAIETRVGGHVFQLNFSNGQGTTFGQLARGGYPNSLYLGFNLARKFF